MSLDLPAARRRLAIMGGLTVVSVIAALAALTGYFKFGLDWGLIAFAAAVAVGVGAQIWFIASLWRASKGA